MNWGVIVFLNIKFETTKSFIHFIFFGSFGGASMINIKNIGINEVKDMLYFAVTSKTADTIKSITDLNCFKLWQKNKLI